MGLASPSHDPFIVYPGRALGRHVIGLACAVVVTVGLFWAMHRLVTPSWQALDAPQFGQLLDFVRVVREETVARRDPKPEPPPQPLQPPAAPTLPQPDPVRPVVVPVIAPPVPVASRIDLSPAGFSLGEGDGEYLPLVKVAPIYPRRALNRGIEGHVIVEFTVTEHGAVRDARVVERVPDSGLFDAAALTAVEKFKYKPRILDGSAVAVTGVRNKITFRLER
jgi:protein TonB